MNCIFLRRSVSAKKGRMYNICAACRLSALLLSCFCITLTVQAQSTINATGGSKTISGNHYAYSIGEMAIIGTAGSGKVIVTQGLLQPANGVTGITESLIPSGALQVYPNPVSDFLILKPDFKSSCTLAYKLYDAQGRLILEQAAHLQSGKEQQRLDINGLAAGNYILKAFVKRNNTMLKQSFKIQKLQ